MLRKKLFEPTTQEKRTSGPEVDILDLSLQNCPPGEVSKFFPNMNPVSSEHHLFANQLLEIQQNLNNCLNQVNFLNPPIKKYCQSKKKLLFVGMNPGPYGMCQTGVPFGDTNWVKNWLQIEAPVSKPPIECPLRPIQGFNCTRKEKSGDRFWKFWYDNCGTAEIFFRNAFVYNHCPLAFMDKDGRNVTPADIKDISIRQLEAICDKFYLDIINLIQPEIVIAIGRYIEKRTLVLFKKSNLHIPVLYMPHPSPRSPNNHNWPEKAKSFIETNKLMQYFQ